jgi:hypothetical protein
MLFGYLTLFTALILSLSAAVYSILGLTAIFAAAFWPIVIMGGSLEFGKIITTLWLHKYWDRAELQYKVYLCSAVAILMLLTSMGVFGFLSKAHTDQSLVSGDVQGKIAIYDEKIKISRENIDANRKALKQMDEAVDQVMARSSDEKGADKAVAIRRGQQKERGRLLVEIEAEQKKITSLNEERAPIAAEVRKVEAEVGPIKYIAAMVYGDNPDANVLEKAVRWVIILIVIVFDPLALTLLLAATKALEWERGINIFVPKKKEEDPWTEFFDKPSTDSDDPTPEEEIPVVEKKPFYAGVSSFWPFPKKEKSTNIVEVETQSPEIEKDTKVSDVEPPINDAMSPEHEDEHDPEDSPELKAAKTLWKEQNPHDTLKHQRNLLAMGKIDQLPWIGLVADNETPRASTSGFGINFPVTANRGDTFLRVDRLPSVLYKFNGDAWIEVDKSLTDNYTYDIAYIEHLIEKLSTGELDPDLLSDSEREQVAQQLQSKTA